MPTPVPVAVDRRNRERRAPRQIAQGNGKYRDVPARSRSSCFKRSASAAPHPESLECKNAHVGQLRQGSVKAPRVRADVDQGPGPGQFSNAFQFSQHGLAPFLCSERGGDRVDAETTTCLERWLFGLGISLARSQQVHPALNRRSSHCASPAGLQQLERVSGPAGRRQNRKHALDHAGLDPIRRGAQPRDLPGELGPSELCQ